MPFLPAFDIIFDIIKNASIAIADERAKGIKAKIFWLWIYASKAKRFWLIMYLVVKNCQWRAKWNCLAPSGNRTRGKCLEGTYVTTTPMVLLLHMTRRLILNYLYTVPLTERVWFIHRFTRVWNSVAFCRRIHTTSISRFLNIEVGRSTQEIVCPQDLLYSLDRCRMSHNVVSTMKGRCKWGNHNPAHPDCAHSH